MANKVYCSGRWWYNYSLASWCYRQAGYYDPSIACDAAIQVSDDAVRQLITALDEAGWIVPRLDERLRTEDLKITHRLLDVIEKSIK